MDKAMFRISCLPDLSLAKYETLSDTGVEGVLERHGAFLRQWNRICFLNNVSMHLLFTFTPTLEAGRRLELFLALQGELDNLEAVSHVLPHSPLSDYYRFERVTDELFLHRYESCATLIKKERTVLVTRGEIGRASWREKV